MAADDKVLKTAIPIIRDKLYLATLHTKPRSTKDIHFFTVDNVLTYEPFFADFGPLHLGNLYRFCMMLEIKMEDPSLASKKLVFYSSQNQQKRANAAYLIASYCVLYLGMTPEEAERPFVGIYPPLLPFRDASYGASTYHLTLIDILRGVHRAKMLGFLDFKNFDVEEYDFFEKVENGDLNWIVPGKFIAFSGPHDSGNYDMGYRMFTPEDYIPIFKRMGVGSIVRLNKTCYDRQKFVNAGFRHYDMYYIDGGTPSDAIVKRFMQAVEEEPGAVAVHCKAGLGRTGSLIDLFMMKHYGFTAAEAIAWTRICRPGSVIGPQQHYLHDMQGKMWAAGEAFRRKHGIASPEEEARMLKATRFTAAPSAPPSFASRGADPGRSSPPPLHRPPSDASLAAGRTSPARDRSTEPMERTPEREFEDRSRIPIAGSPSRVADRILGAPRALPSSPYTPTAHAPHVSSETPGRNASGKIRSPGMLPVDMLRDREAVAMSSPSAIPYPASSPSRYAAAGPSPTPTSYPSPVRRSSQYTSSAASIPYTSSGPASRVRAASALGSPPSYSAIGRSSPTAPSAAMMDGRAAPLSGRRSATGVPRSGTSQRTPPSPTGVSPGLRTGLISAGAAPTSAASRRPLGGAFTSSPYAQRMPRSTTYFQR